LRAILFILHVLTDVLHYFLTVVTLTRVARRHCVHHGLALDLLHEHGERDLLIAKLACEQVLEEALDAVLVRV
jgi:hypothetical protein